MNSQKTENYTKGRTMKELKNLIEAINDNIYNIDSSVIINRSEDEMPVIPLQYISEELELASRVSNIDAETLYKAYAWFKRNDYNVYIDIVTNVISIILSILLQKAGFFKRGIDKLSGKHISNNSFGVI